MANRKILSFLLILCILFFPGCSQSPTESDSSRVAQVQSPDTTLEEDERCAKDGIEGSMTYAEAKRIAEESECGKEGPLKTTHWCDSLSGTWWIDTPIKKPGCTPTCVVDVVSKEARIDWMCMGEETTNPVATTMSVPTSVVHVVTTRYVVTTYYQAPTTMPQEHGFDDDYVPLGFGLVYTPDAPPAGAVLLPLTRGASSEYVGYNIKLGYLKMVSKYGVSGAVLYVTKPDGSKVPVSLSYDECRKAYNDARIDDVVLRLHSAYETAANRNVRIYAWKYSEFSVQKTIPPFEKPNAAAELVEVSSEGMTKYKGYQLGIDMLYYSSEYHPYILSLYVRRPDGTDARVRIKEGKRVRLDNLNFASPFCGTVEEAQATMRGSVWIWEGSDASVDTTPQQEIWDLSYKPEKAPGGAVSLDVTSEGFDSEYAGYKFKVDHLLYVEEYSVSGAVLEVETPDGETTYAKMGYDECAKSYYDAQLGDMVLRLMSAHESAGTLEARVYAWSYKSVPVVKKQVQSQAPNPGAKLLEVTDEGFTAAYGGYKFSLQDIGYASMYHPSILILDIQGPDGVINEGVIKEGLKTRVKNLNLASPFCGTVEEAGIRKAAVWVWEGSDSSVVATPREELFPLTYVPDKPPSGAVPLDVSSEGFTASYGGYKFKTDYFIYSREYGISGISLDIQKPDGTIMQRKLGYDECHKSYYDLQIDDVILRLISARDYSSLQEARLYAWSYKASPVVKSRAAYEKPDPSAKLLEGVTSDGFGQQYNGYKFKVDSLVYSEEYHVSGIFLDVMRPDGTIKQVIISEGSSAKVDDINIASPFCGSVYEAAAMQSAALWVW